jgi:hypothetical protein
MDLKVIEALIASLGVIVSICMAYFISKKTLKIEQKKIDRQRIQDYTIPLLQKRIEVYPNIYFQLSEFVNIMHDHSPTNIELRDFEVKLGELSCKYAVFLGAYTGKNMYDLRKYLTGIIKKTEQKNTKHELRDLIQKLEIGLKVDIGIFFSDIDNNGRDRGRRYEKYGDINKDF